MAKYRKDGSTRRVTAALTRGAHKGALRASHRLEGAIAIGLTGSRSGKLYKRGKGRIHQASAPGEKPATDSGELMGSIRVVDLTKGSVIRVRTTVQALHGRILEEGSKHMKPRPFVTPAVAEEKQAMRDDIVRELRIELGKL